MSTVRDLHQEAMAFAQEALLHRERGDLTTAQSLAAQALPLEIKAANLIAKEPRTEPTRSILYQSAASLAIQIGDYALAQRLVADGLSGFPPPRVEQQLKELFEQINFESHLRPRNGPLGIAQMQLAIVGNAVGPGRAPYSVFNDRIQALITMLNRTVRRITGEPYHRSGPGTAISRLFTPIVSAPQSGSFSVMIELVQRNDSQHTFLTSGRDIVDQVMESIRLVQDERIDELELRIRDKGYFVNFMASAQQLAPDGENVTMVGLTSAHAEVMFTQSRQSLVVPALPEERSKRLMIEATFESTLRGVLDEAIARDHNQIGLTTKENKVFTLLVREGMDDLVRTYFNRPVEVRVRHQDGNLEIVSMESIDE